MKRLKGAEVWTDQQGTVAVKRLDGDYNVYMHVESVSAGIPGKREFMLSEYPAIQAHVAKVKLQILDAKQKKKQARKQRKKNEG